ncbi:MAG: YfhO family protein [Patescibacteria group bacterium]
MIKQLLNNSWPLFIIAIIILIFHSRLFIPYTSFYNPPDYGRSDAWNLSIANKYYYSQQVKLNKLPIWNPLIGTGFPVLAEGQTGIFFLSNIVLFRFLPFPLAYDINIILTFYIAAVGTYFFARSLTLSKIASLYGGILFSMGGFFVVHVQHLHLIQAASILPWLFWAINMYVGSSRKLYLSAFALLLSQQLFAGFPQLVFYTLFGICIYLCIRILLYKNIERSKLMLIILFTILGFGLAAVQLLPTYELLKVSGRSYTGASILEQFPYTYKNLLQFLNPFILGSPKNGTYATWSPGTWGIYWESVAYVGIIPLLLILSSFFFKHREKESKKVFWIFIILGTLSLMLSLGKYSPTHPIFSIPPFNIFRVPSRFLLTTQFSLSLLAAGSLIKFKGKYITWAIIFISTADIFYYFYNYNPTYEAKKWLQPPETAEVIGNNSERILSVGQSENWNKHFLKEGWAKANDYYYFARNSLDQNSNLIFSKSQISAYESLRPKRLKEFTDAIYDGFTVDGNKLTLSDKSARMLTASYLSTIVTTKDLQNDNYEKIYQYKPTGNDTFSVYSNREEPIRTYIATNYTLATSIDEIKAIAKNSTFDPQKKPILEIDPLLSKDFLASSWTTKITGSSENEVNLFADLNGDGILILADSYHPGWSAYDNGQKVEIIPANINQRGLSLKSGGHQITFKYQPSSVFLGALISLTSIIILSIFSVFEYYKSKK